MTTVGKLTKMWHGSSSKGAWEMLDSWLPVASGLADCAENQMTPPTLPKDKHHAPGKEVNECIECFW